ncbi:carbohydrate ABC transporter permease [Radiobacillus sp. PE A8.2]|uniref:carbohydrate ABC transporter permease n=1 Tax=Radiobacillus sp. PE A8.2 TaxID=3380349 RepID=UPI0038900ED1
MELKSSLQKRGNIRKTSRLNNKHYIWCYIFILPQLILYLGFTLWPSIAGIYFSFYNWNGIGWPSDYIGFGNMIEVLKDSYFWNAFGNSFIYTFFLVVLGVPLSLLVALVLNSPSLKFPVFFRTMFFLPIVLTMAIIGIVMKHMFAFEGGLVNMLLMNVGIINDPINWLGSTDIVMITLIAVGIWKSLGIKVVYWLAGLQTLPKELYEAATIDGANRTQQFFYLTIPLLMPFLLTIAFIQMTWAFNVFDLVKTFTNGGPFFSTDVVPLYIYRNAFSPTSGGLPRMGYASAAGVVYGTATMIISIILGILVRKYGSRKY